MKFHDLSENTGKSVLSDGCEILREADASSPEIFRFLRYLAERDLPVEKPLRIEAGKEAYRFEQAELVHPKAWSDEALFAVGSLVRSLHDAGADYVPQDKERFRPWYLRELDGKYRIWCHGDIAPWNLLTRDGMPYLLIDWEYAGPLDPMTELARVLWLFAQLHDDDIAEMQGLPSPKRRAAQVRLICDAYGLAQGERWGMIERIMNVIICETAHEAIGPKLTPESEGSLWGFAWRARSLYWILRHRSILESALQ